MFLTHSLFLLFISADCSSSELDLNLVKRLREFTAITEGSTDTRSMAVLAFLYIYLRVFADTE